jgi:hypothetical protein
MTMQFKSKSALLACRSVVRTPGCDTAICHELTTWYMIANTFFNLPSLYEIWLITKSLVTEHDEDNQNHMDP